MSKIQTISNEETISYAEKEIKNFWLEKNANQLKSTTVNQDNVTEIVNLLAQVQNATICVHSELLSDNKTMTSLFDAVNNDNRIYILTNTLSEESKILYGSCLMRYGIDNIGSFLLVNPHSNAAKGLFFGGQLSSGSLNLKSNILLDLDKEQIEILYRHFCYHFWNTAKFEILDNTGQEHETGNPPIDVYPCVDNFCNIDYIKNILQSQKENCMVITPSIINKDYFDYLAIKNSMIITSLNGNDETILSRIKENGNSIHSYAQGILSNIIMGKEGVWIIPKPTIKHDDIFYALKLNDDQRNKISSIIAQYQNNTNYEFFNTAKRVDLKNKNILCVDKKEHILIKENGNKNIHDIPQNELLLEEEMKQIMPNEFIDDETSISVTYKWTVSPFFLPKDTKKHDLYNNWEKQTNTINNALNSILNDIKTSEENKSILKRISSLWLGKSTKFNSLRNEILDLQKKSYANIPHSELESHITRINDISSTVKKDIGEINEANRIAQIEEDIEKIESKINEKNNELGQKNEQKTQKENEQKDKTEMFCKKYINNKKIEIDTQMEKLSESEKQSKIAEIESKYSAEQNGITAIKNELEQKAGKNNKKEHPKEAEQAEKLLKELNEIQSKAFVEKFNSDIKGIEKDIKNLNDDISRKKQEKSKKPIEVKNESSLKNLNKNNENKSSVEKNTSLIVPNLQQLPSIGNLYQFGNESFLAISDYDEYTEGKKESIRLNAKLCAERS